MRATLWTLAALISHWRRRPGNLATLVLGLAIATALWSGVQALNAQARNSYDAAATAISGGGARTLVAARGGLFDQELFVRLRRAGVNVSPVLEGAVRIGEKNIRIIGVEPVSLPRRSPIAHMRSRADVLEEFFTGPGRGFVAPQTLRRLDLAEGAQPQTERGQQLPPLAALAEAPPGAIIVDIGVAQRLLDRPGKLSRLVIADEETFDEARLKRVVGDALRLVAPDDDSDLARLTDSFHLNLTAFGFLAFLVGLFIVHAAYGLAFEQRLPTLRTLRALGVAPPHLVAAMACEIAVLTLCRGRRGRPRRSRNRAGALCRMSQKVSRASTARKSPIALRSMRAGGSPASQWRARGAALAAASGLTKALRLPALSFARPMAWRGAHHRYLRRQAALAALALVAAAGAYGFGEGLASGFAIIGLALLAARSHSAGRTRRSPGARRAFRAPPARPLVLRRRTPGNFRSFACADGAADCACDQYRRRRHGRGLSPDVRSLARRAPRRRDLFRSGDARRCARHRGVGAHAARHRRDPSCLAREDAHRRMARRRRRHDASRNLYGAFSADRRRAGRVDGPARRRRRPRQRAIGASPESHGRRNARHSDVGRDWPARIVGVFPDYGNPKGQLRIDHEKLKRHFDDASGVHYSLRVDPAATTRVIENMQQRFGGKIARIVDQAEVKSSRPTSSSAHSPSRRR